MLDVSLSVWGDIEDLKIYDVKNAGVKWLVMMSKLIIQNPVEVLEGVLAVYNTANQRLSRLM